MNGEIIFNAGGAEFYHELPAPRLKRRWLCIFLHDWDLAACFGAWTYWQCARCGKRQTLRVPGRIGPRDEQWLQTGVFTRRRLDQGIVAEDCCPRCLGELDTGWECNECGYDASKEANA